jgi:hypothetical protein
MEVSVASRIPPPRAHIPPAQLVGIFEVSPDCRKAGKVGSRRRRYIWSGSQGHKPGLQELMPEDHAEAAE